MQTANISLKIEIGASEAILEKRLTGTADLVISRGEHFSRGWFSFSPFSPPQEHYYRELSSNIYDFRNSVDHFQSGRNVLEKAIGEYFIGNVDEDEILRISGGKEKYLYEISCWGKSSINIRANAAKIFFLIVGPIFSRKAQDLRLSMAKVIARHKSPLVRLGVVLGLKEVKDIVGLEQFLGDNFPEVSEEARLSLEELACDPL